MKKIFYSQKLHSDDYMKLIEILRKNNIGVCMNPYEWVECAVFTEKNRFGYYEVSCKNCQNELKGWKSDTETIEKEIEILPR